MIFLLLISPGIISSLIYCKQKKITLKSVEFFVYIFSFSFLILLFNIGIMYIRGYKNLLLNEMINT